MESHRAPPVFRDFQKLGRRTARLLPENPQLHPLHFHSNRTHRLRVPRPPSLSHSCRTHPTTTPITPPSSASNHPSMELHYPTQSVKLAPPGNLWVTYRR